LMETFPASDPIAVSDPIKRLGLAGEADATGSLLANP
jgi:hypothetical protein